MGYKNDIVAEMLDKMQTIDNYNEINRDSTYDIMREIEVYAGYRLKDSFKENWRFMGLNNTDLIRLTLIEHTGDELFTNTPWNK